MPTRRNADHRAEFAHPKDPDYRRPCFPANITPLPSAPMCQYGSTCYRRNPEHFRHYKHPDPSIYCTYSHVYNNSNKTND